MAIKWLTNAGGLAEPVQMHGTAKETWTDDKITCTVQLRCEWAKRYETLINILRWAPSWPYHTDQVCFATYGTITNAEGPNTADGSGLNYDEALLDLTFESVTRKEDNNSGEVTVYDESIEPTAEMLTLPPNDFRWGSAAGEVLKTEEAQGRLELGLDYVVTLYNLMSIPASVLTLGGKSNDAPIVSKSLGLTFDTETLLFNPPKITRKISLGKTSFYTLQVRYTHKPNTWNKFWRAGKNPTPGYDYIYHKDIAGTPYKNFPPASFAGLVP